MAVQSQGRGSVLGAGDSYVALVVLGVADQVGGVGGQRQVGVGPERGGGDDRGPVGGEAQVDGQEPGIGRVDHAVQVGVGADDVARLAGGCPHRLRQQGRVVAVDV